MPTSPSELPASFLGDHELARLSATLHIVRQRQQPLGKCRVAGAAAYRRPQRHHRRRLLQRRCVGQQCRAASLACTNAQRSPNFSVTHSAFRAAVRELRRVVHVVDRDRHILAVANVEPDGSVAFTLTRVSVFAVGVSRFTRGPTVVRVQLNRPSSFNWPDLLSMLKLKSALALGISAAVPSSVKVAMHGLNGVEQDVIVGITGRYRLASVRALQLPRPRLTIHNDAQSSMVASRESVSSSTVRPSLVYMGLKDGAWRWPSSYPPPRSRSPQTPSGHLQTCRRRSQ